MNTLLTLDESDVASVLTYRELIPLMAKTLEQFSAGEAQQPVRQVLPIEEEQRYFGIMPAATAAGMGAKLVSFYPKNAGTEFHTHLASIVLFDTEHGEPIAFMDGRLITEMRTAATSAAVTRAIAPDNSSVLALIGSGVQAAAHLEALSELYSFNDVRVWSRTAQHAEAFAAKHGARAVSAEEAVDGADIVVTATNAREPVLEGKWLKPGAHVNSVGSPRPNWRELDDTTMSQTVIADSREAVAVESGDVISSGARIFAEAGEVLSGEKIIPPGATTVFKSVGIAVEDIATARWVHDRVMETRR